MSFVFNYPLTFNAAGSNLIISNSTVNNLLATNISTVSLNSTNAICSTLNVTNITCSTLNVLSLSNSNITQGIYLNGANIPATSYDTQGYNVPNLYHTVGGDLSVSSYWGTSINMGMGGANPSGNTNNARIPNTTSFSVNMLTGSTVGNLFTIRENGRVGIKTIEPLSLLDVRGSLRVVGETDFYGDLYINNSSASQSFGIWTLGSGLGIAVGTIFNDYIKIIANNSPCVYISTGNVQILNGSQTASLTLSDINKGIRYSGSNNGSYFANGFPTDGIVVYGFTDGGLGTKNEDGNKLSVYWNDNQRVGIFNTNPAYALDVSGNCRATSFQSTTGTVSLTTSFSDVYTIASGTRGYITMIAHNGNACMVCGFFEWTTNWTVSSVWPISWNINNVATGTGHTAGGISLTMGSTVTIQAKYTASATASYYVTLL